MKMELNYLLNTAALDMLYKHLEEVDTPKCELRIKHSSGPHRVTIITEASDAGHFIDAVRAIRAECREWL